MVTLSFIRGWSVALALACSFAGCVDEACPGGFDSLQTLAATLQTTNLDVTSSPTLWSNYVVLSLDAPNGRAWPAAVGDSATASPALGVVVLDTADGHRLAIGLPLPALAGDVFDLAPVETKPTSFFEMRPRSTTALLSVYACPAMGRADACQLSASQSVTGTLEVQTAAPLVLHLDAVLADTTVPPVPAHVVGDLTFALSAVRRQCGSHGD